MQRRLRPGSLSLLAAFAFLPACSQQDSAESDAVETAQSEIVKTSGKLKKADTPLFWSGTATNAPPSGNQPDVCAQAKCVRFDLTIDLPCDTFDNRSGGVQIATRWPTIDNALNLYVYQGNTQIATSGGFLAGAADSLILPNVTSGVYTVYVVLDPVDSLATSVDFEALAMVQYDPKPHPTRPLQPDLHVEFPAHITFDTPSFPFFGEPDPAPGETCFNSEKNEDGAHVCLRFDQTLANIGEGPVEVRLAIPHDPNDHSTKVQQRTFFSDSPSHTEDSFAGVYSFDPEEQEYEFNGFTQTKLWQSNQQGSKRLGKLPLRQSNKIAFCMADTNIEKWGQQGVAERTFHAPDCLFPQDSDANFDYLIQGVSKGWFDTYDWYIPGQYIEVSGLADGKYIMDTIVDPNGVLRESDETNNCSSVVVRLTNVDSPNRKVDILGKGPACSYPVTQGFPNLTDDQEADFLKGMIQFEAPESIQDGLGPVFNEASCVKCHAAAGVGGGSERTETRFGKTINGQFDPMVALGGSLLDDHGIGQVSPSCTFAGETVPATSNTQALRRTTPLFGLGLVDAVPDATFWQLATQEAAHNPLTAGRVSTGVDIQSGLTVVAKFGWKAQETSLFQFAGDAYVNELGVTNLLFPNENCPNGDCNLLAQCNPEPQVNDPREQTLDEFAAFMKYLAPLPRGDINGSVQKGEEVFEQIGCNDCHKETLTTGPNAVAALNNVTFHPYSDFLLHDFGGRADQIGQGGASPREMRTQPLWGLRNVTSFLHDGQAHSVEDAIEAHDGQAAASRDAYEALSNKKANQLLDFLNSL